MLIDAPLATPAARATRARLLDLARRRAADTMFLDELSRELRHLVPFTASFWAASDPLTTLAVSPARVENLGRQCARWWEREFLVQDFNLFRDLAQAKQPAASLVRATGGQPGRSARYRELRSELGYGDELRGVFRCGTTVWGLVSLWRTAEEPPFTAGEEKLLAELSTPIAEAFRRATLLHTSHGDGATEAPGLLVFDDHLRLESFNSQAEAWLNELTPTVLCDGDALDAAIPTAIRPVVARAHAVAAGIEEESGRVRVRTRSGRWVVVHGFPLRGVAPGPGRTAVVIEPAKASDIAPLLVAAYGLGPREQQITQMIARGLNTSRIADQLCLSPHTVRDYVKLILDKVGVRSRGELVAHLFAEHYWEPLRDGITRAPHGPA